MKKTTKSLTAAAFFPFMTGPELGQQELTQLVDALRPHFDGLSENQKAELKIRAANLPLGGSEALAAFQLSLITIFPFPFPPFPPIFWEQTGEIVISSVAIGLILIGIGIMLL